MFSVINKNNRGFSLLELMLAMAILGVVTYFVVTLTGSVRHGGKVGETKQRMEVVAGKMREYYRAQGNLPVPVGVTLVAGTTYTWDVPVDLLNLEGKFAYDGWGQRMQYVMRTRATNTNTDIAALTVDGVLRMAGILISGGGDQNIPTATWAGGTAAYTATTTGDDIVVAINVNSEATEIALAEVRELQRRVNQFDNLFTGPDACAQAADATSDSCTPGGGTPVWALGVVNCGTGSLDQIQHVGSGTTVNNYGCDTNWYTTIGRASDFSAAEPVLNFIVGYYALGNNYLLDPWGNPYQWGCANTICTTAAPAMPPGNPRYRKFFSLGPDGCTWGTIALEPYCVAGAPIADHERDDIIP